MTAILVAAVFAVQMAVDGVALKAAIDTWVDAASPADQSAAFQVAEAVRWTEKGLGGLFQFINGITLLALGVSITLAILWSLGDLRFLIDNLLSMRRCRF